MPYKQLPDLNSYQEKLIELVFKFRFINRHQLQKILNYKDPKRLNERLKDLVEKKYLGRIYSKKLLENTKPAVYYLETNGILWIRINSNLGNNSDGELELKSVKKFYQDKNTTQKFRDHCIALCNVYLKFKEIADTSTYDYEYLTKTENWIFHQVWEELDDIKSFIPDLQIGKIDDEGYSYTDFIEVIESHVPLFALRYKVDQYLQLNDNEGAREKMFGIDKYPILYFIFPNQYKLNRIGSYIKDRLEESYDVEEMIFKLTTYDKVLRDGVQGNIWRTIQNI